MRLYGALNPIDGIPMPPDTVVTKLLTGGTGEAADWPDDAHIVRFSGMTTASNDVSDWSGYHFMVNLISTHATVPTEGSSVTSGTTAGSTGNSIPVIGEKTFQIPSFSTGWSCIGIGNGYVFAEIWRK